MLSDGSVRTFYVNVYEVANRPGDFVYGAFYKTLDEALQAARANADSAYVYTAKIVEEPMTLPFSVERGFEI